MRLPLNPDISSRDGSSIKNARMTNVLSEKKPTGQVVSAVRPGLTQVASTTGSGKGLVCWNGTLMAMYGTSAYKKTSGTISLPQSYAWSGIVWNESIFCVVAEGTNLATSTNVSATSPDGITWTQRTMSASALWRGLAWNGSVFCTVSYGSNKSCVSTDGINWSNGTLPSTDNWTAVAWNGTVFCAIAYSSAKAATSADGITWVARALPTNEQWTDIAWNGTKFCAIAAGGIPP